MINSNGVMSSVCHWVEWSRFGQKTPLVQAKNYSPNTTKPKGLGEPSGGRYSAAPPAPPRSEAVAEALAAVVLPEASRRGLGFGSDLRRSRCLSIGPPLGFGRDDNIYSFAWSIHIKVQSSSSEMIPVVIRAFSRGVFTE